MTGVAEETERVLAGSLSPSRAADFKTCPLLYRFRSVDKIPQRPTADKARGTLVHAVLDRLFDLPAPQRTYEQAAALVAPEWATLAEAEPETAALFEGGGLAEWLDSARRMVAGYFALEDPSRLEPAAREQLVEAVLDLGPTRGARPGAARVRRPAGRRADRRDPRGRLQDRRDPAGGVRGEGPVPAEVLRAGALADPGHGAAPAQADVSSDRDTLAYRPDAAELERFERTLVAVWRAIERASPPATSGPTQPAVRVVRLPGAVPVARWHASALPRPRRRAAAGRDPRGPQPGRPCRRTAGAPASTVRWRRISIAAPDVPGTGAP